MARCEPIKPGCGPRKTKKYSKQRIDKGQKYVKSRHHKGDLGHFFTYYSSVSSPLPIKDVNCEWKKIDQTCHPSQPEYQKFPPSYMTEVCCIADGTKRIVENKLKYAFWLTKYPGRDGNYIVTGYYEVDHNKVKNIKGYSNYCKRKCRNSKREKCYALYAKLSAEGKAYAHFVKAEDAFPITLKWWNKNMKKKGEGITLLNKWYMKRVIYNTDVVRDLIRHLNHGQNVISEYIKEDKRLKRLGY